MTGGYTGKILRIDLTAKKITREQLPEETVLRKYIGGTGLAVRILNKEVSAHTQPLSPENRLIFMTGPMTGTKYPCSSDTTVVTINANTGYTIGDSHTHGFFGAYLKFAGYDGMIFQGASDRPVYLRIDDDNVEILDAADLWGKDTHETEDFLKERYGSQKTSVAAIGPAGENMIHGACIANDGHHLAAKCGVGTVMGSKKLKAIAVSGTGKVPVMDPDKLSNIIKTWTEINFGGGKKPLLWHGGITKFYELMVGNQNWAVHKNMLAPEEGRQWVHNMVEGNKQFKITADHCWSCPIGCGYTSEITFGPHKGYKATLTGGGEGQEGAAGILGIMDPGTVQYLTDLNDRLGVDSADIGICTGLAFELYERGLLTKEQTDGLELKWNNAEAAEALLRKIVNREGFGRVFAEGPKKAVEILGGDAGKYIIHIKGAGYNMHDWRTAWGVLLGQFVGAAGGTWQGSFGNDMVPEADLGYPQPNALFSTENLSDVVSKSCKKRLWEDSYGGCVFGNLFDVPGGAKYMPMALEAVTGWQNFNLDEALTIGHRIMTLERIFNMKS